MDFVEDEEVDVAVDDVEVAGTEEVDGVVLGVETRAGDGGR